MNEFPELTRSVILSYRVCLWLRPAKDSNKNGIKYPKKMIQVGEGEAIG